MDYRQLIDEFQKNGNEEKAAGMKAYMRDQFEFLGIPTPLRRSLCREFFKAEKKGGLVNWDFVDACWSSPFRELQYVAADYLATMNAFLTPKDIPKIKKLATTKSWWDTIDALDAIVGTIAFTSPKVVEVLRKWSTDDNLWLRRIAIDHQLNRRDQTDTQLLEEVIVNNLGSSEFFINKAIGWSLREYSKTDPEWVRDFIEKYRDRLNSLSIREASKYL